MLDHSGGIAVRVPLLPWRTVTDLTGGAAREAWRTGGDVEGAVAADRAHLDARLREVVADDVVRAALALASPDLDGAVERWLADPAAPPPLGLVAYVLRMAGRCVPFGLFAGCASGAVEGEPAFELTSELRVRARLDLGAADLLAPAVAETYVPNSTLHTSGGRLRLVERVPGGGTVRYHPLAVEENDAIRAVLDAAEGGAPLDALARVLVGEEATFEEAYAFVGELVAAQLLVPDVPLVTGGGLADVASAELRALEAAPSRATVQAAVAAVRAVVDVPPDRAVHVDLDRQGTFVLGPRALAEARRAVEVLHTLHREQPVDADLAAFVAAYEARYGDAEVPLLDALDPEHGIGFGSPPAVAVTGAPMLRGFNPAPSMDGPPWTPIDHHLVDLMSRALRDGQRRFELPDHELHSLRNQRPVPLPSSLALVATVLPGDHRLLVHGAGGPDAVALFSRFVPDLARRHVREEERRAGVTFAEVVHLPERRAGNVAARPALRDTEIPLLAAAAAPRRIPPRDLTVSVVDGRILLRDPDGGQVLPRLSAPHDTGVSALPLYRFLAAVARHGTAHTLRWSWGSIESAPFLPGVTYGRLVLARAQWRWFQRELDDLVRAPTDAARYGALMRLREAWDVPRHVTLARGDNEIPVDLDGVVAADLLAREARRANQLTLREDVTEHCVTGPGGGYAHEVVLPLHGPAPVAEPRRASVRGRAYLPADGWLAATVETSPATADALLRQVVAPLVADAEQWWYDRSPGLRLRVRGDAAALLARLREALAPYVADGRVADVRVETYRASASDAAAHADSAACLRLLADDLDARWRAAYWGLDRLLDDAHVTDRAATIRRLRDGLVADLGETGARARRLAGRIARARRADLAEPDAQVRAVLDERSRALAGTLGEDGLEEACRGHVTRLLRGAHEVQQVVLYDLLDRRGGRYGQ